MNNTVIDLYHLTPHKNNLYSKLMDLNGDPLVLEGDDVPPIKPQKVDLSKGEVIIATPSSLDLCCTTAKGKMDVSVHKI